MIIVLPLIWLALWFVLALVIGAFSGLAPAGYGLMLFLIIFLGGGVGLLIVGLVGRYVWGRLRNR